MIEILPTHCANCGQDLYSSGCVALGCTGSGCDDCGTGCDLDFVPDGRCAAALAAEDPTDRAARLNAQRAAIGLEPL